VHTSIGHNVIPGKKQLPCALENMMTAQAVDREEGSKLKEKEKRSPLESASTRVLKKTYEKRLTCGNGPLEEEIGEKEKRKDIVGISNDKEFKKKKKSLVCVWCCLLLIQSGYFCLRFSIGFSFAVFH
jgi:hypothetical protein